MIKLIFRYYFKIFFTGDCPHLRKTLRHRRVKQEAHNPVGGGPTGGKKFNPSRLGGAMARKRDGAMLQAAT